MLYKIKFWNRVICLPLLLSVQGVEWGSRKTMACINFISSLLFWFISSMVFKRAWPICSRVMELKFLSVARLQANGDGNEIMKFWRIPSFFVGNARSSNSCLFSSSSSLPNKFCFTPSSSDSSFVIFLIFFDLFGGFWGVKRSQEFRPQYLICFSFFSWIWFFDSVWCHMPLCRF
mgnify:CR=1 FL=1